MDVPYDRLVELFRGLGCPDPEWLATRQIENGWPELAKATFMALAWQKVQSESDDSWIEKWIADSHRYRDGPCMSAGLAIEKMLAQGVDRDTIVDLVRTTQAQLIWDLLYQLDDSGSSADLPIGDRPEIRRVGWALFETDEEFKPIQSFGDLHDEFIEYDPTGRRMGPRPS